MPMMRTFWMLFRGELEDCTRVNVAMFAKVSPRELTRLIHAFNENGIQGLWDRYYRRRPLKPPVADSLAYPIFSEDEKERIKADIRRLIATRFDPGNMRECALRDCAQRGIPCGEILEKMHRGRKEVGGREADRIIAPGLLKETGS